MNAGGDGANSLGTTPRFSFLMITYNQEQYIADALNSALAQDYPNLEIIVSDDCSSDRTFAIATDIASNYHGPHKIILNRNEPNLGIGGNFYKAYTLSSGEWLFMAAGDDISLPNRCRVVAEAIPKYPRALVIASNYEIIDEDNRHLGYNFAASPMRIGAALAWHRRIFSDFPPLGLENKLEDFPLYTRVFFLNGVYLCLPEVLLKYRIDGHSYTGATRNTAQSVMSFRYKNAVACIACTQQRMQDLHYAQEHWRVKHSEHFTQRLQWLLKYLSLERDLCAESLRVMSASVSEQLRYLVTPTSREWHRSFFFRLRTILSSNALFLYCTRRFRGQPPVATIETRRRPQVVPGQNLISSEDFLNNPACDLFSTSFVDRFFHDESGWLCLTPPPKITVRTVCVYRQGNLCICEKEEQPPA